MVVWGSKCPSGGPNGRLDFQMVVWSSKWPSGATNARLDLQMAVWTSKFPSGISNRRLAGKTYNYLGDSNGCQFGQAHAKFYVLAKPRPDPMPRPSQVQGQSRFGATIGSDRHGVISD